MVNIMIYLKNRHNAKELIRFLLTEKLIASASIDENNISYVLNGDHFSEELNCVITAQSKSLLFVEIVEAVKLHIGEEVPVISTPIVGANKIFDEGVRSKTIQI